MKCGGPVRVAIEERAADPPVEHAGKCLVVRLGPPLAHDLGLRAVALREASDPEPLGVRRAASEARVLGGVLFLEALLHPGGPLLRPSWLRSSSRPAWRRSWFPSPPSWRATPRAAWCDVPSASSVWRAAGG